MLVSKVYKAEQLLKTYTTKELKTLVERAEKYGMVNQKDRLHYKIAKKLLKEVK